jgi:purine-cytosine permease-like protein
MEKLDGHIFTPIILFLVLAIATVHYGINALILYGIIAAPTMLFVIFLLYMEAAFGFKPLDKIFGSCKKTPQDAQKQDVSACAAAK